MTLISPESRSVTRLGMTPASTTHWIFSLGPSVRYDRAQQASAKTCKRLHLYFRIIFYPQFKNVNKIHLGLTTGCQWRGIDYAPEHHLLDQRFLILLVCQKDNATEQTRIMPRNSLWKSDSKTNSTAESSVAASPMTKGLNAKQTSRSWCCISWARQGRHCFTTSKGGEGFLFLNKCRTWDGTEKQILIDMYIWDLVHGYLHRFEIVQVTFLRKGAGVSDFTRASRGCIYKT